MSKIITALAGTVAAVFCGPANAAPDFAPNPGVGWILDNGDLKRPPNGPGPIVNDPEHPHINGNDFRATGRQPTFPVADPRNPILQPWAREELRKHNERVLTGKQGFSRAATCWPVGVPGYLNYSVQPVFFVQGPKEVVMIWQTDHQVRRIYLADRHSPQVKPSWYGESIGHYDGDTLVVDTIGLSTRTFVDNYETPHTEQLHVVERYHLVDGGRAMQVSVHVEDPGAFTTPWNAEQRYHRSEPPKSGKAPLNPEDIGGTSSTAEPGPLLESSCAENNVSYFGADALPIPTAIRADF